MNNIENDVTVNVSGSGDEVTYTSQRSQKFSAEDYVAVYNDTVDQLQSNINQLENTQNDIEMLLDEKEEAMNILHSLVESEEQEDAELKANSLTVDDINSFMQLQQKNQQRKQMQNQITQTRQQLMDMREAARMVAEDEDDLKEAPEPEKEEVSLST